VYLFVQNPEAMRLVRKLEKNMNRIKSICLHI
ncbi:hypothetical protein PGSY75_0802700, partial [Plasmodium gaboni]